jgi:DNA-binding GntR family transcriptional regulator
MDNMVNEKKTQSGMKMQSITDQVEYALRDKIVLGEYEPGMRITEIGLVNEFGVSQSCIREALYRLEANGLVIKKRNTWTEVTVLTADDVEEITNIRISMETLAIEQAQRKGAFDFESLYKTAIETDKALAEGDYISYTANEMGFHHRLVYACGETRYWKIWSSVALLCKMLVCTCARESELRLIVKSGINHLEVVKTLECGDISASTEILRRHIADSIPSF